MFVRATTVYSREGMIDKLVDIYTKSIIPAAQKQKGYQGAHLLIDRENLKGISLTYWDSEADENATGESQYYSDQLLKILVLLSADPYKEGYEVEFKDGDVL